MESPEVQFIATLPNSTFSRLINVIILLLCEVYDESDGVEAKTMDVI